MAGKLFTIGHSTQSAVHFFKLLKDNGVDILVDVRSTPFSRYAPQFNAGTIEESAKKAGIIYISEKDAFGARQTDASLYSKEGYLDFNKMRASQKFKHKMAEYIEKMRSGKNVVFMCTEKDPLACHRVIMVARGFALQGLPVDHIMTDGKIISQEELDKKLVNTYFPGHNQDSLFSEYSEEDDSTLVKKAYDMQNAKVGYKLSDVLAKTTNLYKGNSTEKEEVKLWDGVDERGGLLTTKDRIGSFRGEYGFLSNMHDCPVEYKGIMYKCSEAAYQAQRCAYESDAKQFIDLDGVQAKKLARKVDTRPDWHDVKVQIMEEIVSAKFEQNPILGKQLIATGDRLLAEGNHWRDTFWGVYNGRGENMLGKILMKVRDNLEKDIPLTKPTKTDKKKSADKGEFVIAVTGHRPHLMFGYDWKNDGNKALSARIASVLKETVEEARKQGYNKFRIVTGMALGSDQMFTAHALRMANTDEYKGKMTVEAAIPFEGQEKKWSEAGQKMYNVLVNACHEITVCSDGGYSAKAMQDRNEYMVDKANIVLSVYDGKSNGGTKNCIDYAVAKGVPVKDIGLPELLKEHTSTQKKSNKLSPKGKGNGNDDLGR